MNGLIKSNLVPWNDRPIWFDIYKSFPPDRDPLYRSVLSSEEATAPLPPKLLYQEDELRAYYFKKISPLPEIVLNSNITKPIWELFIETFDELAKEGISRESLVAATIEKLNKEGHFMKMGKTINELNESVEDQDASMDELKQDILSALSMFSENEQTSKINSDAATTDTMDKNGSSKSDRSE